MEVLTVRPGQTLKLGNRVEIAVCAGNGKSLNLVVKKPSNVALQHKAGISIDHEQLKRLLYDSGLREDS